MILVTICRNVLSDWYYPCLNYPNPGFCYPEPLKKEPTP